MATLDFRDLFEMLMDRPGDWLKFEGSTKGKKFFHWFRASRKGGRIVSHRQTETGIAEPLSQDQFRIMFRNWTWRFIG